MDDDWYDGNSGIDRQYETAFFKGPDLFIQAAGAFRKDHYIRPVSDCFGRSGNAVKCRTLVGAVNTDITATPHCRSENRYTKKFGFCQPPELEWQASQKHRDVEIALMVCHEDVGLGWVDFGDTFDFYFNPADEKNKISPEPGNQMGRIPGFTKKSKNYNNRSQYDRHQHNRC
jgi:hypothetical protein